MENFPSVSVVTWLVVPFCKTVTPSIGSASVSRTTPVTVAPCCAETKFGAKIPIIRKMPATMQSNGGELMHLLFFIISHYLSLKFVSQQPGSGIHYPDVYVFSWMVYLGMLYWYVCSRSEEHTSELQSREKLVCRLLLEK